MAAEVRVRGVPELGSDMRRMVDGIEDAAANAGQRTAQDVAELIRADVPRQTGALAGSVVVDDALGGNAVGVGYDGSVPYSGWIDWGGTRGRAYVAEGRYLMPAATGEAAVRDLTEAMERATQQEVSTTRWSNP
jgi:hypothetical protein